MQHLVEQQAPQAQAVIEADVDDLECHIIVAGIAYQHARVQVAHSDLEVEGGFAAGIHPAIASAASRRRGSADGLHTATAARSLEESRQGVFRRDAEIAALPHPSPEGSGSSGASFNSIGESPLRAGTTISRFQLHQRLRRHDANFPRILPSQQAAGAEQFVQQGSGVSVVQPRQRLDGLHLHVGRGVGRQVALRQSQQADASPGDRW